MQEIFIYRYKEKPPDVHEFPVLLKNGRTAKGHTTFKEKRRDDKTIDKEIERSREDMRTLDLKIPMQHDRFQFLEEHIKILEREKRFNANLEFVGVGEVAFGTGMKEQEVS